MPQCSVCGGHGRTYTGRYERCYTCGGSGVGSDTNTRCGACSGSGNSTVEVRDICWQCGGSGNLEGSSTSQGNTNSVTKSKTTKTTGKSAPAKTDSNNVFNIIGFLSIATGVITLFVGFEEGGKPEEIWIAAGLVVVVAFIVLYIIYFALIFAFYGAIFFAIALVIGNLLEVEIAQEIWADIKEIIEPNSEPKVATALPQTSTQPAYGWTMCNKSDSPTVSVAIAYSDSSEFVKKGWYTIDRGTCRSLLNIISSQYLYYYAEGTSGKWTGEKQFCAHPTQAFTFSGKTCPSQYKLHPFVSIDTGSKLRWTTNLVQ